MRVIGVIQAKMDSSRLPGKVLADIEGKPLIWHIYKRLQSVSKISEVVISTTNMPSEKPLREFAISEEIPYYAGSKDDLIDRIYNTGKKFKSDILVKINADCPLIDPKLVSDGISMFLSLKNKPDLVTNCVEETFPEGMQYSIFSFNTIEHLWSTIKQPFWREFFYRYIIENKHRFSVINIKSPKNLSSLRWTVDYAEDLEFVRKVYEKLYRKNQLFGMDDILNLLDVYPHLSKINEKYSSKIGINNFNKLKKEFQNTL
jgi:spore coat polysaccharide biosynthesis protein SpsF